jgi:uncharacterized damage-inducible protein DinB
MYRIETVLNSWRSVRQDTAQAVEDMPSAELDFKPVPELGSFREIAHHILGAGQALTGLLLDGIVDLTTPEFRPALKARWPPPPKDAGAAALASELRSLLEERLAEIATQPPEFFASTATWHDGQQVTRLEMLEKIKDHELTHLSQLFVFLRLKGIVPATTRRRQAKK